MKHQSIKKCGKIKRCGIIIVSVDANSPKALIIKQTSDPFYWGFPKGKMEHWETEESTACRETLEEVGIKFNTKMLKHKFVYQHHTYFLVVLKKRPIVTVDRGEISEYKWASYKELVALEHCSGHTSNIVFKIRDYFPRMLTVEVFVEKNEKSYMVVNKDGSQLQMLTTVAFPLKSLIYRKYFISANVYPSRIIVYCHKDIRLKLGHKFIHTTVRKEQSDNIDKLLAN